MSTISDMASQLIELRREVVAFQRVNLLLIQAVCESLVRRGILTPSQVLARHAELNRSMATNTWRRGEARILGLTANKTPVASEPILRIIEGGRLDP
jgi:hypothetical protein